MQLLKYNPCATMVKGKAPPVTASARRALAAPAGRRVTATAKVNSPSTSAKPKAAAATAVPSCGGCGTLITDNVKSLQCDRCQEDQWKCIECLNLSGDVYDQLITDPTCSLKWYCDNCDKVISFTDTDNVSAAITSSVKLVMEQCIETFRVMFKDLECNVLKQMAVFEQQLDEVKRTIETRSDTTSAIDSLATGVKIMENRLTDKICAVEKNFGKSVDIGEVQKICDSLQSAADVRDCVEGVVKSKLEEDKYEEQEIEYRKTSVIIHGISESVAETPDDRIDNDLLQVAAMLAELKTPEVKVEKIIRLGKRSPESNSDDDPPKPRPIKAILDSEENKIRVIRNAKNLRRAKEGGWEKVFVHQDLTPKQREARNLLVQELKARVAQGETDLTIYRGAVVKRRGH